MPRLQQLEAISSVHRRQRTAIGVVQELEPSGKPAFVVRVGVEDLEVPYLAMKWVRDSRVTLDLAQTPLQLWAAVQHAREAVAP
jgi:hypothetical protein